MEIANLVHRCGDDVQLKMIPNYEFHKKEVCYITKALLCVEGDNYFITQQMGTNTLSIGYTDSEPDKGTCKKIKKIVSAKLCWQNLILVLLGFFWNRCFDLRYFILLAFCVFLCKIWVNKFNFDFIVKFLDGYKKFFAPKKGK